MVKARELLRFLTKNGYRKVRQTGSHAILESSERPMLVIPIHPGDMPKGLLVRILKDAGFTLDDFRRG